MSKSTHSAIFIISSLLLLLVFAFASGAVEAADAKAMLSWEAPTERVDGTPMGVEEIREYRVFYTVDGPVDPAGDYDTLQAFQTAEAVMLNLTPRAEPYTVNFAIAVVDTDGLVSALSSTVSKTFDVDSTAAPVVPTNLQITITCGEGCTIEAVPSP